MFSEDLDYNEFLNQSELDQLLADGDFALEGWNEEEISIEVCDPGVYRINIPERPFFGPSAVYVIEELDRLVTDAEGHLILDLTACKFLSSIALGFLGKIALEREERGWLVVVAGPNERVRKVIRLLNLDSILAIHESVSAARQILADHPGPASPPPSGEEDEAAT